jgi:LPS export ABC transporter protein LptC
MGRARNTRILKWLLAAVAVITVTGVGGMFYLVRTVRENPEQILSVLPDDTEISLDNIEHTATSEGRTQWRLQAESARLTEGKRQLRLTRPTVVFYPDNGEAITLSAEEGTLALSSNDIAMSGNVVVSNPDYRLATDNLRYTHTDKVLASDHQVVIEGRWAELTAQTMRVNVESGTAVFDGNVKGWLARDTS